MANPFTFAILGCGNRGQTFADWLRDHPHAGRVVAVADPLDDRLQKIATQHQVPPNAQFASWESLLEKPRLADVVICTLMDRLHAPAALRSLDKGYHMLLEKPMATTLDDCIAIDAARQRNNRIVSICHSLRYHTVYAEVKRLLQSNAIGRLITFEQLEGIDPLHQSHSFVRGNWANEARSCFALMTKSCHDIDIVAYLAAAPCRRVSSFGSLSYFRKENAPPGATLRCTDGCPAEPACPYSALQIYVAPALNWYYEAAGFAGLSSAERMLLLRTGPYGRCVYQTDNDVVDHQVVALEFAGGITGTFTMTAFAPPGRHLRLHGSEAQLRADIDGRTIEITRFSDRATTNITFAPQSGSHGGGDSNFMENLIHALRANDSGAVLTSTAESLATHRIVFAAEQSRRERRVVEL